MKNGTEKHIETVNYLAKLYDYCNKKLFGGELTRPVITVQRDERNKTNGWWSVKKVWKENDKDEGRARTEYDGATTQPPYQSNSGNAHTRNVSPIRKRS